LTLGLGSSVFVFVGGLCVTVGIVCGILPALRATRRGARLAAARAVPGARESTRFLAGKSLIVVQVALSLVLLMGAGLFVRTLVNLRSQPLGFNPHRVLLFQMDGTDAGYTGARLLDLYERMLERVTAIPGVQAASMARYGLLSGGATRDGILVPGAPAGQNEVGVHLHFIAPRHFETMGIRLIGGRDLAPQDREAAPLVAVVNQSLARALVAAAGGPVLGRPILYGSPDTRIEIVGIVDDARFASLREPAPRTLYLPYRQHPQHRMTFAARTAGDPLAIVGAVRQAAESLAPTVPVHEVRTQQAQIDAAVRQERLFASVAAGFAALALTLACLGIYGTLGYAVTRRTSEIGLRMALGAGRRDVVLMMIRESLVPVAIGLVAGVTTAWTTLHLIEANLFGLTPHDQPTLILAIVALVASALIAAWLPSRRASAVDPMTALRAD
jgi:predicted permease